MQHSAQPPEIVWRVLAATFLLLILPASARPQAPAVVFQQYCVPCHSERMKTGGFVIHPEAAARPGEDAGYWENVVRKLRSNSMPPGGAPRPAAATIDRVIASLESKLDQSAAAIPNPGKLPLLHRLTRTEYRNAIRDLLKLADLPKEFDYTVLLPPDNSASGFDNLADLLFVSPTVLERYVDAAQKISALAIGDPTAPPLVNIYRISDEQWQDAHIEDLPTGTRGGIAIRSHFPLDGEYVVKVEFAGSSSHEERLDLLVDGERVQGAVIEAPPRRPGLRVGAGPVPKPREFRIPIKAGPRLIGITFVEENQTRDEETLRPQMRGWGTRVALSNVTISGPYKAGRPGDTPSREAVFVCRPSSTEAELPCARRILSHLVQLGYRRPATGADLSLLERFYQTGSKEGGFERGIQRALERVLVSPQFLFRIEREPAGLPAGTPYRITDLELASRLSFFLWSSIPDEALLEAAARGQLHDPAVLEKQTRRMLADPRSAALVTNFAEQWLFLRDIESKKPDDLIFQDFDETLREAFRQETVLFLDSVIREDRSVLDLLAARYTFLNERLARHYGIPGIRGSHFRRVNLPPDSPRGGLLGQGSILTITSYATRTSPVVRGKWVLENLLSSPPPPPPANVPALKTEGGNRKPLSMRDAMTLHRADPACAGCHSRMDPIGFAMENFDAIGRWRVHDNGNPIDAAGVFPDGTKIDGMVGLKRALLEHPGEFVDTLAEKLLMFAIGRNVQYYDRPAIRAIVRDAAKDGYAFSAFVLGIVKSVPFQMRTAAGEKKSIGERN